MSKSWYNKCLPRVKDVKPLLPKIAEEVRGIKGVKKIYVWGSLAEHTNDPEFRIKDIDLLIKTSFHSGDLVSIDNLAMDEESTTEELIDQGYDPGVIQFSRKLAGVDGSLLDYWAISKDKKILHWGPIFAERPESDDIKKEAEEHAEKVTGCPTKRLNKSSNKTRTNWYVNYTDYIDKHLCDMPTGWYKSEVTNIKEILSSAYEV